MSKVTNAKLNTKQALFCEYYVACNNGTDAYQEAYHCTRESARRLASQLLTNIDVQSYVDELRQKKESDRLINRHKLQQSILNSIELQLEFSQRLMTLANFKAKEFENNPKSVTTDWLNAIARVGESAARVEKIAHENLIIESGIDAIVNDIKQRSHLN